MTRLSLIGIALLAAPLALSGCGSDPAPTQPVAAVQGKTLILQPSTVTDWKDVGALVTSVDMADARARIPGILESMSALLGQWGCEVVTALDLPQALQHLQGRAPEVILADYHLDDDVLGCEVIQQLRETYAMPIPALIISADRSDACRRELLALGAPLLNKPVKPGKLRAVLSQLLQDSSGV